MRRNFLLITGLALLSGSIVALIMRKKDEKVEPILNYGDSSTPPDYNQIIFNNDDDVDSKSPEYDDDESQQELFEGEKLSSEDLAELEKIKVAMADDTLVEEIPKTPQTPADFVSKPKSGAKQLKKEKSENV